ncbi:MAG TPA: DNA gyrase inhibitor YacG [Acidobacteriaceae bacterium]|nr:DNA gyrase inhibitor YacG [Acidobacteriaceae bacterium]
MSANQALRCPICRTLVTKDDEHFPFCNARCRLIDLGKWASGEYRISSPILDPEVLEGLDEASRRPRNEEDDDPEAS